MKSVLGGSVRSVHQLKNLRRFAFYGLENDQVVFDESEISSISSHGSKLRKIRVRTIMLGYSDALKKKLEQILDCFIPKLVEFAKRHPNRKIKAKLPLTTLKYFKSILPVNLILN